MSNHSTVSLPNIRHNIIVLTDTTVELSTRKSHLFKGITRLKLEVKVNGQIRDRVYLFSQKGNPGVWEAERLVMFPISDGECVVTVFQKLNEYEHQLLASTVFRKQVLSSFPKSSSGDPRITKSKRQKKALGDADGNSFHSRQAFVSGIRKKFTRLPRILKMTTKDTTKGLFEITLTSHTNSPDLILKTRALIAENEEELISSMANWIAEQVIASQDEATIAKMRKAVDELISNALKWFSSPCWRKRRLHIRISSVTAIRTV
ncbi:hypothetical protein CPB86DRAFT_797953 [Serendipita vermifera]|nr:hypothetical protein CPB86DRAFT_797953 [Serendipita vermifera]